MAAGHRRESPGFLILGMSPKQITATAVGILTSATVVIGIVVAAVHNAAQQVKTIRDELQQHPPTTAQDLDRIQRQVTDQTRALKQDVHDQISQIDDTPSQAIVKAPDPKPLTPHHAPKTAPVATPAPTPSPTPTPHILPPLPPLLP